jgi:quinol monooxygenase YgiN
MNVVLVNIHVKDEYLEEFKQAAIENASTSIHEPGVVRFDFIQQLADPARFTLVEVYQDEEAQRSHKETAHYKKWFETVKDMMAEPRVGTRYTNLFPGDGGWKKFSDEI